MEWKDKVGVVEIADAGLHFKMIKQLYRANILITKHLGNPEFRKYLIDNQDKVILHATITGWGGTEIESGVKSWIQTIANLKYLVESGFPKEHVVLRCDPIIPNDEGIRRAYYVIHNWLEYNPKSRIRISTVDGYKHVRDRFANAGIEFPFPHGFHATTKYQLKVVDMVKEILKEFPEAIIESCAETYPATGFIKKVGCVSKRDLEILGIDDIELRGLSGQRKQCLCPSNKTQLIFRKKTRCSSKCLYCYLGKNQNNK